MKCVFNIFNNNYILLSKTSSNIFLIKKHLYIHNNYEILTFYLFTLAYYAGNL